MKLLASGQSDRGCIRANNEDSYFCDAGLGLFIVADGMGGASAGEHASKLAVDTVVECLQGAPTRDTETLIAALREANRRVIEAGRSEAGKHGMGTTLVAALDTGNELLVASVGDSRAYVLDGESLRAVTVDQTWVQEVGRPLGIDEQSLRVHPLRHVLTMAIGAGAPLVVHCYSVALAPGAILLLSSDGLHGVLEHDQMEAILRRPASDTPSLMTKCRQLIEAARNAGGPDNITAVVVKREES
jgi:PPM family protein phosphatase